MYLKHHPELLEEVSEPGLFLDSVPEVRLAERLHELGLLPEDQRKKFVATVSNYALDGEDTDALGDEGIRTLFHDDEFEDLVQRVRTELLPRLGDVRREWESNHYSGDPSEHMQQLLESFDTLKKRFGGDADSAKIIDREIQRANEWIGEHSPEESEREPRELGKVEAADPTENERSIFDDIDADVDDEEEAVH